MRATRLCRRSDAREKVWRASSIETAKPVCSAYEVCKNCLDPIISRYGPARLIDSSTTAAVATSRTFFSQCIDTKLGMFSYRGRALHVTSCKMVTAHVAPKLQTLPCTKRETTCSVSNVTTLLSPSSSLLRPARSFVWRSARHGLYGTSSDLHPVHRKSVQRIFLKRLGDFFDGNFGDFSLEFNRIGDVRMARPDRAQPEDRRLYFRIGVSIWKVCYQAATN
jgi:hypothetical protein